MEMLQHLGAGFEAAFTLTNMMFICGGVTLGIIFGVTPGVGSVTALAILVPITFYMSPLAAIAFLVGINKGGNGLWVTVTVGHHNRYLCAFACVTCAADYRRVAIALCIHLNRECRWCVIKVI